MPSMQQVIFHEQNVAEQERRRAMIEADRTRQLAGVTAEQRAQEARYAAERDAALAAYQRQAAEQQASLQGGLMNQQAGLQERRDVGLFNQAITRDQWNVVNQGQLMNQQAGIDLNRDRNRVDLQAQLNQVILTQGEQAEARRVREAVAAVNRQTDLSPEEKTMLITQLETKLNPLENRMRQAQIIQSQLQSQSLYQNMTQQETMFRDRQEYRRNAMNGQLPTLQLRLPNGELVHGYIDQNGNPAILDTSWAQQGREITNTAGVVGIASDAQRIMQGQRLFQGRLEHQGLVNEGLRNANDFVRNANPMELDLLRQRVQQGPQQFRSVQEHRDAQTALFRLDAEQRPQEFQYRLRELAANASILEDRARNSPTDIRLRNEATEARTLHDRASTAAINVDLEPEAIRLRRDVSRGVLSASAANEELTRTRTRLETEQGDRAWLHGALGIIGMATGQPIGGGGAGGGSGRPQQLTFMQAEGIHNDATNDLRTENRARRDNGQPALAGDEAAAFIARRVQERTRAITDITSVVNQGMTQAQREMLRTMIEAQPEDRRRRLGYIQPPPNFNPLGAPPSQNLIRDLGEAMTDAAGRGQTTRQLDRPSAPSNTLGPNSAPPRPDIPPHIANANRQHSEAFDILRPMIESNGPLTPEQIRRARFAFGLLEGEWQSQGQRQPAPAITMRIRAWLQEKNPGVDFSHDAR